MKENRPNIFIYSQSIRTGKTTLLMDWVRQQKKVAGILTPDVEGKRHVYNVATKAMRRLQLNEGDAGLVIGRFVMDEKVLRDAQQILHDARSSDAEWIIVDEVGRLEVDRNEGLEPELQQLIYHFKNNSTTQKLLLVVRDYLLDKVIAHYQLEAAQVLPPNFFTTNPQPKPLTGVVLCGGNSVRMGQDKALLQYHGMPQYERVVALLQTFCESVVLSVNEHFTQQILSQQASPHAVIDDAQYANQGPMTGVLSCIDAFPDRPFFIVGCDYPFLERRDLLPLFNARNGTRDAICFLHPNTKIAEPLLTIYEAHALQGLKAFLKEGNQSLRFYLKQINTLYLTPTAPIALRSVDTQEEMLLFQEQYAARKE